MIHRLGWCGHRVEVQTSTYTHPTAEAMTTARDALTRVYRKAGEAL